MDQNINIGTVKPYDLFALLYDECDADGCNANPFTMATQIVPGDGGPLQDQTITITVQQAYYYHAAWIKNGLVETLQTVADSVFQPSNVAWRSCTTGLACEECVVGCNSTVQQYRLPSSMAIYHGDAGGEATDWINIGLKVDGQDNVESGCKDLTGLASAAAGILDGSGSLSAIFSLLGLSCDAMG